MSILATNGFSCNAQIQFAGASISGSKITALLRRGSQTRLIDASGVDLTSFSPRAMRRAWRRASRRGGRRQHTDKAPRPRRLINPAA